MTIDIIKLDSYLKKWQAILRLRDWDILSRMVDIGWRKSGDIKIDSSNKMAVVSSGGEKPSTNRLKEMIEAEIG
ncbi:hypothetical protein G9F73_013630 [Clostridium estertheticum]|uniref:hypothetical protein n=1 Tax=Clostridium estertheticum TaxID=238834 RepID=UPI0013EEBF16|nr:hypothetical protein [Clostridium estertheticum]MBZ9608844.1 hypothetical protein [Clostridium estertheticum]